MAIYLIRHTTPNIEKGICYGQTDLELATDHLFEFEMVKKNLPQDPSIIISSPLNRCLMLANYLNVISRVITDPRLMELNFGDWELMSWEQIPSKEIDPWYLDYINVCPPNGESFLQLSMRVNDFYKDWIVDRKEDLIVISHAGAIRALLARHYNISLEESLKIPIKYGEVIKI